MSYSQSKKLTDTEKKLQALRAQLYGKDRDVTPSPSKPNTFSFKSSEDNPSLKTHKVRMDTAYLKHDLLKILLLASLMIGAQVALFLGLNQGLIKF